VGLPSAASRSINTTAHAVTSGVAALTHTKLGHAGDMLATLKNRGHVDITHAVFLRKM